MVYLLLQMRQWKGRQLSADRRQAGSATKYVRACSLHLLSAVILNLSESIAMFLFVVTCVVLMWEDWREENQDRVRQQI